MIFAMPSLADLPLATAPGRTRRVMVNQTGITPGDRGTVPSFTALVVLVRQVPGSAGRLLQRWGAGPEESLGAGWKDLQNPAKAVASMREQWLFWKNLNFPRQRDIVPGMVAGTDLPGSC
jgi:hypothetical protein